MERAAAPATLTAQREPDASLDRVAFSATLHCLTGCAVGEVTGMAIATALGWSDVGQIALAVGLAYLFGFSLTAIPLVRAGLSAGAVVSTALAADTISITDHRGDRQSVCCPRPGRDGRRCWRRPALGQRRWWLRHRIFRSRSLRTGG